MLHFNSDTIYIPRENTSVFGSIIPQEVILSDIDIAPVGNLNLSLKGHGIDLSPVVLKVDCERGHFQGPNILIWSELDLLLGVSGRFLLCEGFNLG